MSQSDIQAPILVAEGLDLAVFASVEEAEGQVESPDVESYEVYDSDGQRLRFVGKTEPKGRFIKSVDIAPVHLVADEPDPEHPEQLRHLILQCLNAVAESEDSYNSASLPELVEVARLRFGVNNQGNPRLSH